MGETETPHFHDFGISGRVPEPKTIYFYLGDTRTPQIIQEKTRPFFENDFCKSQISGNHLWNFWKRRAPKILSKAWIMLDDLGILVNLEKSRSENLSKS